MSDKVFERSLMALSTAAILWIVLACIFGILGLAWIITIGLVVWIVGGGALLNLWGIYYMSRV